MALKKFNEEFAKQFDNQYLSNLDVEEKAHADLDPTYANAVIQYKKVREKIKDDFKEQDKMVDEFLKASELEENPKLPDTENKAELKAMKLAENMLTESDLQPLTESEPDPYKIRAKVASVIYHRLRDQVFEDPIPAQEMALKVAGYDVDWCPEEYDDRQLNLESKIDSILGQLADIQADTYFKSELIEALEESALNEASISTMIAAFENKIDELEGTNESLQEGFAPAYVCGEDSGGLGDPGELLTLDDLHQMYDEMKDSDPVVSEYSSFESWLEDTVNSGYLRPNFNEALQEGAKPLTEDYANFIGKPLKDFLRTIDRGTQLNLDYSETDDGISGMSGTCAQVPWSVADRIIKDIQLGDERYYKFKIITEAVSEQAEPLEEEAVTEARKPGSVSDDEDAHRYKVVAANEDSKPLWVKDVKGVASAKKRLVELTDDKLSELGATQVYITRDDNKEVFLKFSNDDGSWDTIQDDLEMELPVEDRNTDFNAIVADLCAESTPDVKALRRMSRKGEGYVGFEDDEIGFENDVFHLRSQSDKPISWAKKVADFYGYKTSEVKLGSGGYKFIDIYAPGISDDPKLVP